MNLSCAECVYNEDDSRKWVEPVTLVAGHLMCGMHARELMRKQRVMGRSVFDQIQQHGR
jgi:hypothetical protein